MQDKVKNEIQEIIITLKKQGKTNLANKIKDNWDKTLFEYSKSLINKESKPLEVFFTKALEIELKRLKYNQNEIKDILKYIKTRRSLQTTPHISPAQKPRYFFINYLTSLTLTPKDYYLVAMFSGLPFSNNTKPGRLMTMEGGINLISSQKQDALVYGNKIEQKTIDVWTHLPQEIKQVIPKPKENEDYTSWAISSSLAIEKPYLKGKPVFFDFNEVIKNYLILAIEDPKSILSQILFDKKNLNILEENFKDEVFFYKPNKKGKYDFVESYYLKGNNLQSNKNKILLNRANLKKELQENYLCPGMPLSFLIYAFLNNFLCYGSFAQVEYLPKYKKNFLKVPILKNIISNSKDGALTTGSFPDNISLHPLDLYINKNIDLDKYKNTLFGESIIAIKDVLLYQNYSNKYENKMTKNKKTKNKIHLIGICGKGMSGLAIMLKQKGYEVSGSDEGFYDPVASMLTKNKIKILTPHKKENIPKDVDIVVIGKHAKLTPEENEEVREAFAMGIVIKSLPEAIGDLINDKENTVIVGSFGKSTMTSLITYILHESKKDPSYFIGAVPINFKQNAYLGKGKNFILEGDEYPSSNWDHTSKMIHMNPKNAIFISGEHDHINIFPTEKDYIKPFEKFVKLLPANGLLVACKHEKNVLSISKKTKAKIVYYGIHEINSYHAENIIYGKKTTFDLYKGDKKIINLKTNLLGRHNIENIIGASSFVLEKKLVTREQLQKAILKFKGLSGRLDEKVSKSSVLIYEGFGSSYAKAKSVFEALNLHFGEKRLITVFEPHTFSWRNEEAKTWYKDIFASSSIVIILPPPTHGASTHNQMSQEDIIKIVKEYKGENVYGPKNEEETLNVLKNILEKNDLIALVSSGSLFGLTKSIPELVSKIFPK